MKIIISGILICIFMPLSAAELKKYSTPSYSDRSVKTRGIIRNPMLRALGQETSRSSNSLTRLELRKVDKVVEILSGMDQNKVVQWINTYRSKMSKAVKSGKITEARYYQAILEKWRNIQGIN